MRRQTSRRPARARSCPCSTWSGLRRTDTSRRRRRGDHAKFNFYAESRTSVARLDLVADAHAPAAPVAVVAFPFIVARAFLGFDELFEDARFLLTVVICVEKSLDAARLGRRD